MMDALEFVGGAALLLVMFEVAYRLDKWNRAKVEQVRKKWGLK